jgi:hypothetical protein
MLSALIALQPSKNSFLQQEGKGTLINNYKRVLLKGNIVQ